MRMGLHFVLALLAFQQVAAWSTSTLNSRLAHSNVQQSSSALHSIRRVSPQPYPRESSTINRRDGIQQIIQQSAAVITTTTAILSNSYVQPAMAYTPDSDPLRESLYLMSRVQEATVQQERFVNRATQQDALKNKMKLTLRLVEKNYRLLDQITFASEYVTPSSKVVEATTAGYEAAEALQNAIDYVSSDLKAGDFENGQKEYLTSNLGECRERLFDFLSYMPKDKLDEARKRVEEGELLMVVESMVLFHTCFIILCKHMSAET